MSDHSPDSLLICSPEIELPKDVKYLGHEDPASKLLDIPNLYVLQLSPETVLDKRETLKMTYISIFGFYFGVMDYP